MSFSESIEETPVIVVTYNRPRHTQKVIDAIRRHKRKNLYIFSDGPKSSRDSILVKQTRSVFETIDWCKPEIIERDTNIGLAKSIVNAVEYVFRKNDQLILLEDDCIPQRYFFEFVEACLKRYRSFENIFGICGYTVPIPYSVLKNYPYDLYFYSRIGSWGWATWKRAWDFYDPDLNRLYRSALKKNINLTQGGEDIPVNIAKLLRGEIKDIWTLNWVLSVYLQRGFYIYPTKSHIDNIGNDGTGVHCGRTNLFNTEYADRTPINFPNEIILDNDLIKNYNKIFDHNKRPKVKNIDPKFHFSKNKNLFEPDNRELKIIHINTHDIAGGAAKVANRLIECQSEAGQKATMVVGYKSSPKPFSTPFPIDSEKDVEDQCKREGKLYYEYQGSHKLVQHPLIRSCDLIHLHNLHGGYFNPFSIYGLSHVKPIVWTLHDMHSFTGHCAHSFDCNKWEFGCGKCPYLSTEPAITVDNTRQLIKDKKFIYDHSYLQIVTPSSWLKKKAQRSILKNFPIELIHNGVDVNIFRPHNKLKAKEKFNIPQNRFVIGAVAHGGALTNQWKGGEHSLEAMGILSSQYPEILFLNIGAQEKSKHPNILNLPHLSEESQIALAYSALDIFMYTPKADNCPLVVIEALSCGIPIVTFETGGIPELVRNKVDGYIAGYKNVNEIVHFVKLLISDSKLRDQCSRNARKHAIDKFDQRLIHQKYMNLYLRCIKEHVEKSKTLKFFPSYKVPEIIKTPAFFEAEAIKSNMPNNNVEQKNKTYKFSKNAKSKIQNENDSLKKPVAPILVYTMGKVGSTTVKASLEGLNIPVFHVHFLSKVYIAEIEEIYKNTLKLKIPDHLMRGKQIGSLIDRTWGTIRWKIVSLVREPIARTISDVFQNMSDFIPELENLDEEQKYYFLKKHIIEILEKFDEKTDYVCNWFDREIKTVFNFDVFSYKFDKVKGYQIYKADQADILIVKLENLSDCVSNAFNDFLSIENIKLNKANIGKKKTYHDLYQRILKNIRIPNCILDNIYSSQYSQYFYTKDQIKIFKEKWSENSINVFSAFLNNFKLRLNNKSHDTNLTQKGFTLLRNCNKVDTNKEPKSKDIISTNNHLPKIIIVTPSYNQGGFLEECIDSILSQNYPNLEYIIMDGGSTDGSLNIIKKYEKHLTYWRSKPDGGQYPAINLGFKKSNAEIMGWLNSDDKLHPNALFKIGYIFSVHKEVEWISGLVTKWDEQGSLIEIEERLRLWSYRDFLARQYKWIQQESTFWKKSLWEKAGGYIDSSFKLAGDLDLWTRFFRFAQLFRVCDLLGGYRIHGNQKARLFMDEYIREAESIIDREICFVQKEKGIRLLSSPEPIIINEKKLHDFISTIHSLSTKKSSIASFYN